MSELIPFGSVRLDGGTQMRAEINQEVVAEYADLMAAGVEFPPITLFYDGSTYWLADGFHRYLAQRKSANEQLHRDLTYVAADVRPGTRRDAILYSVQANGSHGLRRTNADKRRAIETLLRDEEWGQWSNHKIAQLCLVSDKTVGLVRSQLFGRSANSVRVYRNSHGQIGTMNTANISGANRNRQYPSPKPNRRGARPDQSEGSPEYELRRNLKAVERQFKSSVRIHIDILRRLPDGPELLLSFAQWIAQTAKGLWPMADGSTDDALQAELARAYRHIESLERALDAKERFRPALPGVIAYSSTDIEGMP